MTQPKVRKSSFAATVACGVLLVTVVDGARAERCTPGGFGGRPSPAQPRSPSDPDFTADVEARQRYGVAALEIVGFDVALNQVNRHVSDSSDYDSNLKTIRRNLRSSWGVDNDPFRINQLAHPYQGSVYHGIARSSGLDYWEAAGYTFAGSVFWEIAGEKTRPSANDQVASGIGGSFLGETLYRMANLVLESNNGTPLLRELGAAFISPPTGVNRWAHDYGDCLFASHDPLYYSRAQIGYSRASESDAGRSTTAQKRNEVVAEYALDYGLPSDESYASRWSGRTDASGESDVSRKPRRSIYTYDRPFDYFTFQATASSANGVESVLTRGTLFAAIYPETWEVNGLYGLFGSYDYVAPQTFRISTTALSLGTVAVWKPSRQVEFQGSALFGAGYAAVGTVRSPDPTAYRYGVAPQGLLALRMIFDDRWSVDLTGREYFVSRVAAAKRGGHENIARLDASITRKFYGQNAVSIKYLGNRRDASQPDFGNFRQTRATIGIYYTRLGRDALASTTDR